MSESEKATQRRVLRCAAFVGLVLGLVCPMLPADYHHACGTIAHALTLTCGS